MLADLLPSFAINHDVTLIVNKNVENHFSKSIAQSGVNIVSLEINHPYNPISIFKLSRYFKKYDVVHVHLFPSLYWAALAGCVVRTQLVFTEHNTHNKRRNLWWCRPLEQWVYKRYSKIISISELTQRNLMKWLRASNDDSRFVVVNNGINLMDFSHTESHKDYPHTLIMVARFAPAKDQATIIRAMKLLEEDVHLILVGDGSSKKACMELAHSLQVDKRVHFVGNQSNVSTWLSKSDIGIQSSIWEGFGLTAVEMMASGLPVIATDVDGLREVVNDAGLLFPVGDEIVLAEQIRNLLYDEKYYIMVSKRCEERSRLYDISKMSDSYLEIYDHIMKHHHVDAPSDNLGG